MYVFAISVTAYVEFLLNFYSLSPSLLCSYSFCILLNGPLLWKLETLLPANVPLDRWTLEGLNNSCKSKPCFQGVTCVNLPNGSFKCGSCPKGYTGDGRSCHKWTTCLDSPCFAGVRCYDNDETGFTCGPCPHRYTGNGVQCKPSVDCGRDRPCFPGVTCTETSDARGFACGPCPRGLTGDGISCQDIDECALASPCHTADACVNTSPGFKCLPCPSGFTGRPVTGSGIEQARSMKQVCRDVNECDEGANACVPNSQCINTIGSYICGECIEGFIGNQSVGCTADGSACPDGTICDKNAECFIRRGFTKYQCRVSNSHCHQLLLAPTTLTSVTWLIYSANCWPRHCALFVPSIIDCRFAMCLLFQFT